MSRLIRPTALPLIQRSNLAWVPRDHLPRHLALANSNRGVGKKGEGFLSHHGAPVMDRSWEIEQLAEHFSGAPSLFPSSPLYQSLCKVVVGDQPILKLLTQRQPGQQASFLLFGAIHYLLLSGVQHP